MSFEKKGIVDAGEILQILPHRYPFLLLDRVTELIPGKYAAGIKNVTVNEPFFQGHFPGRPIMPGVLIVECLAQLTAVMYCAEYLKEAECSPERLQGLADRVGYLVDIRNLKFRQVVVPGDQLVLTVRKKAQLGKLLQVEAAACVDRKEVVTGILSVSEKE